MSFLNWLKRLFVPDTPPASSASPSARIWVIPPTASTLAPPSTTPDLAKVKKPTPPPKKFDLDADDFLPIARSELIQQAKEGGRSWWGVWFGMRDRIPPATDSRTKLIDRGMVAQGLLTPEQLVEIHRVGDEMERLRPSFDSMRAEAARVGESAVEADREARRARKELKKQEAAERKRLRLESIAERKRTDILYLGRRVSHQLGQRDSDAALLQRKGLPFLATPTDLATALQLSIPQLRWLAYHSEVASRIHYILFSVPKRSGGTRQLAKAHRRLATAQHWVLENILSKLPVEPSAHGFVKDRSTLTNAMPHVQQEVVINLDLENFFPSVTFPRVRSVFKRAGYSPSVATILALLCTECPRRLVSFQGKNYYVATGRRGLPQGACTSPALANQVARRLDKRLNGLANKLGVTTRDTLTTSPSQARRRFSPKQGTSLPAFDI
ncbi:MAG: reverse transcriptase family protein [Gemmatales bacterium]